MDLSTLCAFNAPSGFEKGLRRAIMDAATPFCDSVVIDKAGNVLCFKKGTNPELPTVLIGAHMDEVGFIISGHTEDGFLMMKPIGGIDPRVAVSKWVKVGDDEIPGVIGALAIHLQTPDDRKRVLGFRDLFIDIGAKDKAEAERLAPLGTCAAFDSPYQEFGDGFIVAKALDDRIGCYTMLKLIKNVYPADTWFVFATNEEVGLRGAQGAGHTIQPDIALVLEATAAGDLGNDKEATHICRPGQGVALSFMDGASIGCRQLYRALWDLAQDKGIPHQAKMGVTGGNDAGAYQQAGKGARTLAISVPCRYIHSPCNVSKLSDITAQYDLVHAFLTELKEDI